MELICASAVSLEGKGQSNTCLKWAEKAQVKKGPCLVRFRKDFIGSPAFAVKASGGEAGQPVRAAFLDAQPGPGVCRTPKDFGPVSEGWVARRTVPGAAG